MEKAIVGTELCRCDFTYCSNSCYYFLNAVNNQFMLGQAEIDFLLDGYCIRKISQLKKVEINDDKRNELNKLYGVTAEVKMPEVDISSWKSIFDSLKALDRFIIIEDEINGQFSIGIIEKVLQNKLYFKQFDANGVWDEENLEIPYSQITTVQWDTRYTNVWERYLRKI